MRTTTHSNFARSLLVLVAFSFALGCDRPLLVQGTVVDLEGTPIEAARVTVAVSDDFSVQCETDRNGCFAIGLIQYGWGRVSVAREGYKPVSVEFSDAQVAALRITLAPVNNSSDSNAVVTLLKKEQAPDCGEPDEDA